MSEIHDTDYLKAFAEGDDPIQPDEGRSDLPPHDAGDDIGGAGADAESNQPAADAPTADAESNQPAGGEENPDEFAGLPEAAIARMKELEARAFRAENTLRSNESRFSRTERELNELRGRLLAQPKPEPEQAQPEAAAILDDDTRAKLGEYDDLGPPIIKAFEALQQRVEKAESIAQQGRTQQAERELAQAEQARSEFLNRQQTILHEKYPANEVAEIVASRSYAEWCAGQPNWVKDLVTRNGTALVDGEAAAFVFDKYKTDTATPKQPVDPEEQRRQRQLEGSAHIPSRAPAFAPSDTGESADFDTEWKRAADEEKRAAARR